MQIRRFRLQIRKMANVPYIQKMFMISMSRLNRIHLSEKLRLTIHMILNLPLQNFCGSDGVTRHLKPQSEQEQ